MDYEKMANVDPVAYASEQGHAVRGLSRERILDLLTEVPEESVAVPDEEATLCAMRSCPNRIAVRVAGVRQITLSPKVSGEPKPPNQWQVLKAKAKSLGIKTHGKKRDQIEAEIKEKENG